MSEKPVTSRELDMLKVTAQHQRNSSIPPTNRQLATELCVGESAICNYKRSLREKGYLSEASTDALLTEKAWHLLANLHIVIPTQIPVFGEVVAGRSSQDDLVVNINDIGYFDGLSFPFIDADIPVIAVPKVREMLTVFALKVVGQSMEQEGIFDGDYVIVERFEYDDARAPGQGELIVTHYLPAYARDHIDDDKTIEDSSFLDEYLEGPTVKYYYSKDEKGYHRLSWRKGFNESPYTVKAIYIRPIGRVVGVYRPIPS